MLPGFFLFMRNLLPLFLDLAGRDVLLVGGGPVAAGKLRQLLAAGARVRVVSPLVVAEIASQDVDLQRRAFHPSDLDAAWLVVAASSPETNRQVANAAEERRVFVNAVDDPPNATAYLGGVVRRDAVTIAISTSGDAPALTALMREALDAVLPHDLAEWIETAREQRRAWRRDGIAMEARKPLLLRALNRLYASTADRAEAVHDELLFPASPPVQKVPWLSGPEDSWL